MNELQINNAPICLKSVSGYYPLRDAGKFFIFSLWRWHCVDCNQSTVSCKCKGVFIWILIDYKQSFICWVFTFVRTDTVSYLIKLKTDRQICCLQSRSFEILKNIKRKKNVSTFSHTVWHLSVCSSSVYNKPFHSDWLPLMKRKQ